MASCSRPHYHNLDYDKGGNLSTQKLIPILFSMAFVGNTMAGDNLQFEAQDLARQFVDQLKPQLKKAMTEGGPTRAIEGCASAAPKIADSLSTGSGWTVRRVSLKSRNASRGIPDDWATDYTLGQVRGAISVRKAL